MVKDPEQLAGDKRRLCLECLECCRHLVFVVRPRPRVGQSLGDCVEELERFYRVRGCEIRGLKNSWGGTETWLADVPLPCPHLTPRGCDFYDERPEVCRLYDGRRDPVMRERCRWGELE